MNVDRLVSSREAAWADLEELVRRAKGRPERLSPADVLRLGSLYRGAGADLAALKRNARADPATLRLEELVRKARYLVYDAAPSKSSIVAFFGRDYWVRVRERPGLLAVSALLLFGPGILAAVWALVSPAEASGFVPEAFAGASHPRRGGTDLGVPLAGQAALSTQIFVNNIRVTFLGFALGITFGVGTAVVLVFNGVLLGVVGGLSFAYGNGRTFVALVTAHGLLELSCIVVAAAAGLRIGWALTEPGPRRRVDALRAEARPAVEIVLGTVPWLVCAGLIEGFITPSGFELAGVVGVGIFFAAVFWFLVWRRGRVPATGDARSAAPSV